MRNNTITMAAIIALAALAAPAAAQRPADVPRPSHVPMEFVELLAMGPFGAADAAGAGDVDVMVGLLPESLIDVVRLGPGWRVVGTMVYPMLSVSALVAPGDADTIERDWGVRLAREGWRTQRTDTEPQTGFLASSAEQVIDVRQLCAADNSAVLAILTRPYVADSVVVNILRMTGFMASSCRGTAARAAASADSELPVLTAPDGVTFGRRGTGTAAAAEYSYARARTSLAPAALVEHFTTQLLADGWVPAAPAVGDDVAARTFVRGAGSGARPLSAILTAARLPGGEVDLHLRLVRERR